ncbi:MAG: heavy-metal-associated domain-containing protein [Kyrpidia tusciae]|nr:copper ion binding protein [Kyrpidia tusciae]MBE3551438.1 heavy-metal-associated domain-containing protein [Kyrpidia tusciae]
METKVLHIKGMSCSHCVHAVKSALSALAGVHEVDVDLDKGKASVKFDGSKVGEPQFREAIEEAGYELTGMSDR